MLAKPNIVPTPEGNIQLEWHTEDADLVVEIADGEYDYYFRDDHGDVEGCTSVACIIWGFIQRIGEGQ